MSDPWSAYPAVEADDPWSAYPIVEAEKPPKPSIAEDVAKSGGIGLVEGVISLAGLPVDAYNAANNAGAWVADKFSELTHGRKSSAPYPEQARGGSQDIKSAVESVTGEFYEPQTKAGEVARTVGTFIPGAGTGPVNILKYGVAPALASEAVGQATKGTAVEPLARAGAAVLTGAGIGLATRPGTVGQIIREAAPDLTPTQLQAAEDLMETARLQGMSITLPEAIQHVTNGGTKLADIQRVVEGSSQGGSIMKDFYSGRAAGNEAGVRATLDEIAPVNQNPTEIAPRIQRAAGAELDATRQNINRAAEPFYASTRTVVIPDPQFAPIAANPAFQQGLKAVRSDPILAESIKGLPDNSIGVVDTVKKHLDDLQATAGKAGERFRASQIGSAKDDMLSAADAAAPDYATARDIGRQGRQDELMPLERSPLGQLSEAEKLPEQARILFDPNPLPNSEVQVKEAVTALSKSDPDAARDLVRSHLERTFNEASQKLQSGPNQQGGAKFAAVVAGNPQQAKNLEAAISSLPNGGQALTAFKKTLAVLEAQGQRQAIGSQTEFNKQVTEALGKGGSGRAVTALSPQAIGQYLHGVYQDMRYARNSEVLARLFTSPDAVKQLSKLSGLNPRSYRAREIVARAMVNGYVGYRTTPEATQQ